MSSEQRGRSRSDDPEIHSHLLPKTLAVQDLPPSCKLVAMTLATEGPLTQSAVSDATLMSPRTTRYALSRLEESGEVESRPYVADARQDVYELVEDDGSGPDVMADGGQPDPVLELMNLARHLHDRSRDHRDAARDAVSEESTILSDQLADAYADAADDARELARYLDGDREDSPAYLSHGMELSGSYPVPWREQSGEDGSR